MNINTTNGTTTSAAAPAGTVKNNIKGRTAPQDGSDVSIPNRNGKKAIKNGIKAIDKAITMVQKNNDIIDIPR